MRIGLLEDQRVLRESLADLLVQRGYEVTVACSDPGELIQRMREARPEIVLVDLRLTSEPDDDSGWRAMKMVQQYYPGVRLVVLSGSRDMADVERARTVGASAFLSKDSVSSKDLVAALERVKAGEVVFPLGGLPMQRPFAPAEQAAHRFHLTERETQVLQCIGSGMDNSKIAVTLDITERTVRAHVSNLYRKLGAENRTQLALLSRDLGLRPREA